MRLIIYKCDVCGKSKGDEKDWLITGPVKGVLGLTFARWDEEIAEIGCAKHICGAECAHNVLSSFLSGS